MKYGYLAIEMFNSFDGTRWDNNIDHTKLYHLKEVISLDTLLCPPILKREDYTDHLDCGEGYCYFHDLGWLEKEIKNFERKHILAVVYEPTQECEALDVGDDFVFCGYDLIESGISALTNCGGFDEAFSSQDLTKQGLIKEYNQAIKIQRKLRTNYPFEDHADCTLWAIWKKTDDFR